ncbi:MAG TPA: 2-C-methyl-D-erythritol 2,4-cyclodiphosphate synthase [Bacillota bacterium]|nr:2-C-methyl-D-erythritol 2,4-cyclodiphosphate synthase [Bacillota bacterium]HOA14845.1 2-C-methyl-D-erythritol 2,4-cyclodiphosphate synthase [Bacillota bacterium]
MSKHLGLKVAFGYDSHRIDQTRKLVLGGVEIPGAAGLKGHSDADLICHAVADAIISAAKLGDIGRMFPDDDPEFRDADSLKLLKRAVSAAGSMGYRAINCDCTLIAERPKISGYADLMARNIADALGIEEDAVNVKGKTNEGMDGVGRGEGMQAYAVLLLIRE